MPAQAVRVEAGRWLLQFDERACRLTGAFERKVRSAEARLLVFRQHIRCLRQSDCQQLLDETLHARRQQPLQARTISGDAAVGVTIPSHSLRVHNQCFSCRVVRHLPSEGLF